MKQAVSNAIRTMLLWGSVAACIGLCVNFVHPYRIDYMGSPLPPAVTDPDVPLPKHLSVKEGRTLYETQDALFVDARRIRRFESGHVPGAIPLPWTTFDRYYHDSITELIKRPIIVVYDDGMIDTKARELGRKLIEDGFPTVYHLEGGLGAWVNHGCPIERST
jgi:rhodanese-related sulfurtransferase